MRTSWRARINTWNNFTAVPLVWWTGICSEKGAQEDLRDSSKQPRWERKPSELNAMLGIAWSGKVRICLMRIHPSSHTSDGRAVRLNIMYQHAPLWKLSWMGPMTLILCIVFSSSQLHCKTQWSSGYWPLCGTAQLWAVWQNSPTFLSRHGGALPEKAARTFS